MESQSYAFLYSRREPDQEGAASLAQAGKLTPLAAGALVEPRLQKQTRGYHIHFSAHRALA